MEKYYMFRDLDNQSNLENGKTFHAAGLVQKIFNTKENSDKNKDVSIFFMNPFTGQIISAWRGHQEIEIFECDYFEWMELFQVLSKVKN